MKYNPCLDTIHPDRRAIPLTYSGETFWVKFAKMEERVVSTAVQEWVARLTGMPCFHSTHNPDPFLSLALEAERLREMRGKGYCVPEVFEQTVECLILTDVGQNLNRRLKETQSAQERQGLLKRAMDLIIQMHRAGDYHGRASLRDLTISKDGIGMIDFEHRPLEKMTLAEAQCRDIWLFLLSAMRHAGKDPEAISKLSEQYAKAAKPDTVTALQNAVKMMLPIGRSLARTLGAVGMGRLTPDVVLLNETLHRTLSPV